MGRFDRLPGIDEENTTRRNVLIGSGYVVGGFMVLSVTVSDPDDEGEVPAEAESPADDAADDEDGTDEETDEGAERDPGLLWEDHLDSEQTIVGLSPDGEMVVCALGSDSLAIYEDGDRNDVGLPVSGLMERLTVIDSDSIFLDTGLADVFGLFDADGEMVWGFEMDYLWAANITRDGQTAAAVSSPIEGVGEVAFVEGGEASWITELSESRGFDVATSASTVAVGTEEYDDGDDFGAGQPGVEVYSNGAIEWKHETEYPVSSVSINEESDLIVAGTDDSEVFAFDLAGELRWSLSGAGPYCEISQDGSTVVVSTMAFGDEHPLTAFSPDGDQLWSVEAPISAGWHRELEVSDDGTHALLSDTVENKAVLVIEGEIIWTEEYFGDEQGAVGSGLSANGSTWTVVADPNEEDGVFVETYGFV